MPAELAILLIVGGAWLVGRAGWQRFTTSANQDNGAWFGQLLLGVGIVGWMAFVLAEFGWFNIWLIGGLALIIIPFGLRGIKVQGISSIAHHSLSPSNFVLLTLLPIIWLFFRPHEYLLGAADAGVYVSLGANIARTGSILVQDETLAEMPASLHTLFLRDLPDSEHSPFYLFPAFFVDTPETGQIIPQFYHLYPVWGGIGHSLGGVRANLLLTGLWGALGAMAVYWLVRDWLGWGWGLVAIAGISLNGMQIWFSRYPTSETLTQLLLWGGLWAFSRWRKNGDQMWGFLAGLLLGELFLARIDTFFLLIMPASLLLIQIQQKKLQKHDLSFYLPIFSLFLHSIIHALWQSPPYFYNTFGHFLRLIQAFPALPAGGVAVAGAGAGILWRRRGKPLVLPFPDLWLWAGIVGIVGLALYGWFVRPNTGLPLHQYGDWYSGQQRTNFDRFNLIRLGWYLSPLGVWLGVAGSCRLLYRQSKKALHGGWGIMFVSFFFSLLYLWRIQNNPVQIYAMRRYLPALLPFTIIAAIFALQWVWQKQKIVTVGITLFWLGSFLLFARGFISQVDYAGILDQFEAFNERMPANSILLFNDSALIGQGDFIGTPLQFIYGHRAYSLRYPDQLTAATSKDLHQTIQKWQANGRTVYWVGERNWLEEQVISYQVETVEIAGNLLESSLDHKPTQLIENRWILDLAKLNNVQ